VNERDCAVGPPGRDHIDGCCCCACCCCEDAVVVAYGFSGVIVLCGRLPSSSVRDDDASCEERDQF